jgi:hypothetical protein
MVKEAEVEGKDGSKVTVPIVGERSAGLIRFDRFRRYSKALKDMTEEEFDVLREDIRDRTANLMNKYPQIVDRLSDSKTAAIDEVYAYMLDLIVLMGGSLDGLSLDMEPVDTDPFSAMMRDYDRPNPDEFVQTTYDAQGKRQFSGRIYFKVVSDPQCRFTDKGKSAKNFYITNSSIEVRVPRESRTEFADLRALLTVFEITTDTVENPMHVATVIRNHVYEIMNPTCQLGTPRNEMSLRRWGAKWECAVNLRHLNDLGEDVDNKF